MNLISETSFNVKNACLVTLSDTRRNYEVEHKGKLKAS